MGSVAPPFNLSSPTLLGYAQTIPHSPPDPPSLCFGVRVSCVHIRFLISDPPAPLHRYSALTSCRPFLLPRDLSLPATINPRDLSILLAPASGRVDSLLLPPFRSALSYPLKLACHRAFVAAAADLSPQLASHFAHRCLCVCSRLSHHSLRALLSSRVTFLRLPTAPSKLVAKSSGGRLRWTLRAAARRWWARRRPIWRESLASAGPTCLSKALRVAVCRLGCASIVERCTHTRTHTLSHLNSLPYSIHVYTLTLTLTRPAYMR